MKRFVLTAAFVLATISVWGCTPPAEQEAASDAAQKAEDDKVPVVFASFAGSEEQKKHTLVLAESIRTFGGRYADAPIRVYVPGALKDSNPAVAGKMQALEVELKTATAPDKALWLYFARKVFAAAAAEGDAEKTAALLVWMDEDTVVLREPGELVLEEGKSFGYRPVMHKLIGSAWSEPPDEFWSRVYDRLAIPEGAAFPMTTPADLAAIRPYFNAGLLVVRPERGILRKWAECFSFLYEDKVFVDWCRKDVRKRIFLHQVALVGAVLPPVKREEMIEFSSAVNYPLFHDEMFGDKTKFDSIEEVITIRYDTYFRNPDPSWAENVTGPAEVLSWLKERLDDLSAR
jgi:hypothetical protein